MIYNFSFSFSAEVKAIHCMIAVSKFLFHKEVMSPFYSFNLVCLLQVLISNHPNIYICTLFSCLSGVEILSWQSKSDPAEGDKVNDKAQPEVLKKETPFPLSEWLQPYDDLGIIRELRKLHSEASSRAKIAPKVSNEKAKWMNWPGKTILSFIMF